jgi:hypothetical protein
MSQRTLQLAQGHRREDAVLYIDRTFPPVAASIDGRSVATASSPSSIVYCHCRNQAKLKQVYRNGPNQGRFFYSCGSSDKCLFFAFADNAAHDESTLHIQWHRFSAANGWRLVSSKSGYSPTHVKQGGIGVTNYFTKNQFLPTIILKQSNLTKGLLVPERYRSGSRTTRFDRQHYSKSWRSQ